MNLDLLVRHPLLWLAARRQQLLWEWDDRLEDLDRLARRRVIRARKLLLRK